MDDIEPVKPGLGGIDLSPFEGERGIGVSLGGGGIYPGEGESGLGGEGAVPPVLELERRKDAVHPHDNNRQTPQNPTASGVG